MEIFFPPMRTLICFHPLTSYSKLENAEAEVAGETAALKWCSPYFTFGYIILNRMGERTRFLFYLGVFGLLGVIGQPPVLVGEIYQALVKLQPSLTEQDRWKKAIEIEAICKGLEVDAFLALAVAVKEQELPEPAVDRRYKYDVQAILRGVPVGSIPIPSAWEDFLQLGQSLSDDLKEWQSEEKALLAYFFGSSWLNKNPLIPETRKKFVEQVMAYAEEMRREIRKTPKEQIPTPPKSAAETTELPFPVWSKYDRVRGFYQKWIRMYNPKLSEEEAREIATHILVWSQSEGVSHSLVFAVIAVESRFNPRAKSPKGARGLGQLMPHKAAEVNVRNIYDIEENIRGSVQVLKQLLSKYQNRHTLALAAYNAGEAAVEKYQGIPPYSETQQYVHKVLRLFHSLEKRLKTIE